MTWSRVRTVSAPPIVAMHRCPFLVVVVCMLPGAKSRAACLNMFLSNMYLEVLPGHSSSVRSECEEVLKGRLGVCKFSSVFSITDGRRCFTALKHTKTYPGYLGVSPHLTFHIRTSRTDQGNGRGHAQHESRGQAARNYAAGTGIHRSRSRTLPGGSKKKGCSCSGEHIPPPLEAPVRDGTRFDRSHKCHSYP